MSLPWSLSGETTPSTTSSIRFGSSEGLRTWISSSSPTTRSTGFTSCSEPAFFPLPRGVRMWSYTNASAMTVLAVRFSVVAPENGWRRWPGNPFRPRWRLRDRVETSIVTLLLSLSSRWTGVAWFTRIEETGARHGGERRGPARAVHARRADQPGGDERAQRALLHHQGPRPAADPARPLRLLHPRPRRAARARARAAEPRLHAVGNREVRRQHPPRRHPRGHRAAADDARSVAA